MKDFLSKNIGRIMILGFASYFGALLLLREAIGHYSITHYYFIILFILFSILTFVFPIRPSSLDKYSFKDAFINYLLGLVAGIFILGSTYLFNNYSRTVLRATFFWDYGLDIEFRANGTYKAINSDMMSSNISYGKYSVHGNKIVCKGLKFGSVAILDTLSITDYGTHLEFKLSEKAKGIIGAPMDITHNDLTKH